jgi:uncharacterized membrane protein YphA (DoxX/SURF4 family)
MATRSRPRWPLTVLYWALAAEFLLGAATKFWQGPTFVGPDYGDRFVAWGYPAWFAIVVGAVELGCAVLLVIPRRRSRFLASAAMVLLLTGAVTTHIVNHMAAVDNIAVSAHLVVMAMLALANWPGDWKELLRPWRADARERGSAAA